MALTEHIFGPSLDGSSTYLDTSDADWVDATSVDGSLRIPGGDFLLGARYERLGPDLFLSGEEQSVFVKVTSHTNKHRICIRRMVVR